MKVRGTFLGGNNILIKDKLIYLVLMSVVTPQRKIPSSLDHRVLEM
jgi:hypothetical protein